MRANSFVHVLNCNRVPFKMSWPIDPPYKPKPDIQPRQRHHAAGMVLSQPTESPARRTYCGASQFDGIRNHFAADQRCAHSSAHRDAVEMEMVLNSSGVPPALRMPASRFSGVPQVIVAWPDFNPGVRDAISGFLSRRLQSASVAAWRRAPARFAPSIHAALLAG